jgi:predicted DNA-binding transcriptional regulator YafY
LQTIYQAVWEDRRLEITYRLWIGSEVRGGVDPYGLVARWGAWHLVFALAQGVRAIQVSDLSEVRLLDETFARPPDFDLAGFWSRWTANEPLNRVAYPVVVRLSPGLLPWLPQFLGADVKRALKSAAPPGPDGWQQLTLTFDSLETARSRLLGFGGAVEVVAPEALRLSMADFGRQIATRYST